MKKSILLPYDQYLALKASHHVNQNKPTNENGEEADSAPNHSQLTDEYVLSLLPASSKSRAERILKFIKKSNNINYNDCGEVCINTQPISKSHICDILQFACSSSKTIPKGCVEVFQNLTNIPLSLIVNPNAKALVGGKHPEVVPPGLPDSFRKLDSWKSSWKVL